MSGSFLGRAAAGAKKRLPHCIPWKMPIDEKGHIWYNNVKHKKALAYLLFRIEEASLSKD